MAGRFAALSQVVGLVNSLVTMAVLGRLLSREDFGIAAMAGTIVAFLYMLTDGGLPLAVITSKQISRQQASNLFWVNIAFGVVLSALLCALSPCIAWFYGQAELVPVCAAMSLAFVAAGAGVQHETVLRRNLLAGRSSVVTLAGAICGSVVAIGMAASGWGYWSLVGQIVSAAVARTALLWWLCPWRPDLPRRGAGTMHMLRFGGASTGASILGYANRNVDNALIGWYWGADALGVYSRAYTLITQPLTQIGVPINAVAVPALAAVNTSPDRFAAAYLRTCALSFAVTIPAATAILVLSEPMVLTLLGPSWAASVPIVRVLGGTLIVGTAVSGPIGWLFTTTGRMREMFLWNLVSTPLYVFAYAVALPFGISGVAIAASAAYSVLAVPAFLIATRGTSISRSAVCREAGFPILATIVASVVTTALLSLTDSVPQTARLLAGAGMFVATYLGLWLAFPTRRRYFLDMMARLLPVRVSRWVC